MSQYVPVYLRTYEKTFSGFFKTPWDKWDKWDKWDSTGTTALFRYRRANAPHVEMRCQGGRGLEPEVPGHAEHLGLYAEHHKIMTGALAIRSRALRMWSRYRVITGGPK